MKTVALLVLLALLAGCSTAPASCQGPAFALNPGDWTPGPGDVAVPTLPEAAP